MSYFNYHATAQSLIRQGKLTSFYYVRRHNRISPALVLLFDDVKHPVMPVRREKWAEYQPLLPKEKFDPDKSSLDFAP